MKPHGLHVPNDRIPGTGRHRRLLAGALLLASTTGLAQTVAQQGPNPVQFATTGRIDNRMVLTGAAAQHPGSMTVQVFDAAKFGWITGLSASVKGLELLPDMAAGAYAARVANYKASTAPFSSYDYGLMFQYGAWGFPQNGSAALSISWSTCPRARRPAPSPSR